MSRDDAFFWLFALPLGILFWGLVVFAIVGLFVQLFTPDKKEEDKNVEQ